MEWCHFQYLKWIHDQDFKGTSLFALFDVEHLRNSTRQRYSYNGILIGTYCTFCGTHFRLFLTSSGTVGPTLNRRTENLIAAYTVAEVNGKR